MIEGTAMPQPQIQLRICQHVRPTPLVAKCRNAEGLVVASPKEWHYALCCCYHRASACTGHDPISAIGMAWARNSPNSILSTVCAGRATLKGRDHERRPADRLSCKTRRDGVEPLRSAYRPQRFAYP